MYLLLCINVKRFMIKLEDLSHFFFLFFFFAFFFLFCDSFSPRSFPHQQFLAKKREKPSCYATTTVINVRMLLCRCMMKEAKKDEYKCINTFCVCMHSRQLTQLAVRLDDMFNSSY